MVRVAPCVQSAGGGAGVRGEARAAVRLVLRGLRVSTVNGEAGQTARLFAYDPKLGMLCSSQLSDAAWLHAARWVSQRSTVCQVGAVGRLCTTGIAGRLAARWQPPTWQTWTVCSRSVISQSWSQGAKSGEAAKVRRRPLRLFAGRSAGGETVARRGRNLPGAMVADVTSYDPSRPIRRRSHPETRGTAGGLRPSLDRSAITGRGSQRAAPRRRRAAAATPACALRARTARPSDRASARVRCLCSLPTPRRRLPVALGRSHAC